MSNVGPTTGNMRVIDVRAPQLSEIKFPLCERQY